MTQDPCLLCTDVQTKLKNYYQINYVFDQNWCFFSSNQLYFCYRSTDKSPILHQSCIRNYDKGDKKYNLFHMYYNSTSSIVNILI